MAKKPLKIDCIAGSQLRDTQGEMLDVEGADISELEAGMGRWNDNHGKGHFNSIGYITEAKKIFKREDCTDPRHEHYWEKVKAPFVYCAGYLYDDEDHPNARAAAAIIRNVHRNDIPLKMKASVEGGVIARGIKDPNLLARTKIHSVALTFTPANQATLVEPLDLTKSSETWEADQILIKSVVHLAKKDVPSFRAITRNAQAEKIVDNFRKINELAKANGLTPIPEQTAEQWVAEALSTKISGNINKINALVKQLTPIKKKHETLEKASKKQIKQMTGSPEVADWVSKHLNRDDLATWFARSYKKDPSIFNDENKTKLEHYGAVKDQHKELQDLRLDKSHDFDTGMNHLHEANSAAEKRHQNSDHLIEPEARTEKLMDAGDGYSWYSLGKGSCDKEAAAMGHCGNEPSEEEGDNILSLRKEKKFGDKTYHEPHLTFINNGGYLGEMKGKANAKPTKKYHGAIKKLLESKHVKHVVGGGYESDNNFSLNDLPEKDRKELLDKKPGLNPFSSLKQINRQDFPDKHSKEVDHHNEKVKSINDAFKKHGDLDTALASGTPQQVEDILNHSAFEKHITDGHINDLVYSGDRNIQDHLNIAKSLNGYKLDKGHLSHIIEKIQANDPDYSPDHLNEELASSILNHPNSVKSHFNAAFDQDKTRIAAVASKHFGPEHMEQALNDDNDRVRQAAVGSKHFKPEHVEQALNDEDKWVREIAVRSEHFKPEHVEQALNDDNEFVRQTAIGSKHFGPEHMEQAFNDDNDFVRQAAVGSKHFGPEHMEQALNDKDSSVRRAAIQSKHFKPEHMEQALNDDNENVRQVAIGSKHFGPEHMEQVLNDEDSSVRREAVESKHFKPEHMEQALNDKHEWVKQVAIGSKHFGPEHMEQVLNDEDSSVRRKAVESKHFKPEHMEQALNDEDKWVRKTAVDSKHFGPEHMEQALNDEDEYIRRTATGSEHFKPEHMEQALNDKHEWVREAAVDSKHFGPEHMEQALNDKNERIRRTAVNSKHFGPEHMEQALNDKSEWIRMTATGSKHFKPEHMEQALNDKHEWVREAAVDSKHFKPEIHNKFLPENKQVKLTKSIEDRVHKINELVKALTAGYGGGSPTSATGGQVLQSESLDDGRGNSGFKYFTCPQCGHEQIHGKNQVKCRGCNKNMSLDQLYKLMTRK